MNSAFRIRAPFFEIGPKAYLYGQASLDLALEADRLCEEYDVDIIYTPQCVDIRMIAEATNRLLVFAQHMDPLRIGKGIGSVLPEAIKAAGARGVLLNHSEKKMTLGDLRTAIARADEVGLATLVCADNLAEARAIAQFEPDIILAEPPELIGTRNGSVESRSYVREINEAIRNINPGISVLHGAGIYSAKDVEAIIGLGAEGTGCTSGIVKAEDPTRSMREMIRSLRETWDRTR
ncbi:MAG TPA: triose-phosphate isomerase [Rectinemataceae bacterium]|nr:triose-phosphate isomerase [Rectinemataceae bacterium]